jgi:hypothetical protein
VSLAGDPYLSVVVTARNDDHGGDLLGRMQVFVAGWIEQARRYAIPSELIIVEWNPPQDRPRLIDALRWPEDLGPCEVRFIEVPPELHARYAHGAALPLYQMIAKNVGIRRARGQFLLVTNIDILFSNELAEYLAARRLERGRMYRIDRHDAMSDVPVDAPVAEQLAYCETHLIRVNRREGSFPVKPDGSPLLEARDVAARDSGIGLGSGWYALESYLPPQVFRWAGELAELVLEAPPEPGQALVLDIEPGVTTGGMPLELAIEVDGKAPVRQILDRRQRVRLRFGLQYPTRVRLRTRDGGVRLYSDPRPMNFRLFAVNWERPRKSEDGSQALEATLLPVQWTQRAPTLWHGLMHLLRRLAEGGPLVRLTVPVSNRLRRQLRFYLDCGGLTGMIRHPRAALRACRAGEAASRQPPGNAPKPRQNAPDFLHTNACGDFTLMAREHWFDLRAYPEMDLFSMNLDSLFCFAAHYGGACEEMLADPMRIYHIEHGSGSGWTPEGQAKLFERIAAKGLTFVENEEVLAMAAQMRRFEAPMIFNHEDWGMAAFALPETRVRRRD